MLEWLRSRLDSYAARLILSAAIIGSLIVREPTPEFVWALILLFGIEFVLRSTLWAYDTRRHGVRLASVALLLVDGLAFVSLLPLDVVADNLRYGRVIRLMLLLSYWRPLFRDFLQIATQRQRLSQLLLVSTLALLLTGIGASVLRFVDTSRVDLDADGVISHRDASPDYQTVLWWAFRQVEDPGNLIDSTENGWLLALSLVLTVGGLFLVAVLIGIGTTLVEDLVKAGRTRPVGQKGHMVVLNVDENARGILRNIATYFEKQVRKPRLVAQGLAPERPLFMNSPEFRRTEYRSGHCAQPEALAILDVEDARRVAVLTPGESRHSDAEAVTAVMSIRRTNQNAWIVVELNDPNNVAAALAAGAKRTIPVPARRLAALVLAQELADPGRAQVLLSLVSLEGQELYTCMLGDGRLRETPDTIVVDEPFSTLQRRVHQYNGCLLLGYFSTSPGTGPYTAAPVLNPPSETPPGAVTGLIALAPKFQPLEDAVRGLVDGSIPAVPTPHATESALALIPDEKLEANHILVLGFHDDTVETVGELIQVFEQCEVTVVCNSESERQRMRHAFLSERPRNGAVFQQLNPKQVELRLPLGRSLRVHLRVGDRYADGLFRAGDTSGRVGNIFDYDAVILLSERSTPDPDAATVLAVLKLLESSYTEERLRHVVAEFSAPELAELLSDRAKKAGRSDISFVCTSTLREDILNHSFFVPGLPPVLHDLMTTGDNEICVFTPGNMSGQMTVGSLFIGMQNLTHPIIPIGYRTLDDALVMNPPPEAIIYWDTVQALYCIARAEDEVR